MVEIGKLEQELTGEVWTGPALGESMRVLCDECNGRFAGTVDERRAGHFLLDQMRSFGLANVRAESFEMRGWKRGNARLALLGSDGGQDLPCLALAGSPPGDLEVAVIDAGQGAPADFERLGEAVAGKAVLVHARGPHRLEKYAQAIAAGARAFLFTNARPGMLIPAGSVCLGEPEKELPSLGLSLETGTYMQRLLARAAQDGGEPVRVKISVGGGPQQVTARNIVGELPGTDPEAGWIVVCGHYDGHDIAQGAQDNATGTAVVLEAARVMSGLRTQLKAGLRFVLFSGEEMGMYGSEAYVRDHPDQLDQIRAVFNADIVGLAAPLRLMVQSSPELASYLRGLPLAELDAEVDDSHLVPYSDHFHFTLAGVASLMAVTSPPGEGRGWAHTAADTLDKIELRELRQAAATTARILTHMATSPEDLPSERTSPEDVQEALKAAGLEEPMRVRGAWPF